MGQAQVITNGFEPRRGQIQVYRRMKRFNTLLAHRRWGKTVFAVNLVIRRCLESPLSMPRTHYFANDYGQVKKVAWDYAKLYTECIPGRLVNEAELRIDIPPDRRIQLGSATVGDRNRGIYSDFVVLDEPAQMTTNFFHSIIRPALADRKGGMLAIGTPLARFGLFYDLWEFAAGESDWWRGVYRASQTKVLDPRELRAARRLMKHAKYQSEFECVWGSSVEGAFWGETLARLEDAGHITSVKYDKRHLVYLSFDLGVTDACSVWAFQVINGEYRFIDHMEYTNMSYSDIAASIKDKGWQLGRCIFPHDARQKSQVTGMSRMRTLEQLGLKGVIAPSVSVIDGIDIARTRMEHCYWDQDACRYGLECLRQYQAEYLEEKGVTKTTPLHNWASHAADSFRYFAVTKADKYIKGGSFGGELDYSRMD